MDPFRSDARTGRLTHTHTLEINDSPQLFARNQFWTHCEAFRCLLGLIDRLLELRGADRTPLGASLTSLGQVGGCREASSTGISRQIALTNTARQNTCKN